MEDCDTGYAATAAASRSRGSKSVVLDKIKEILLPTSATWALLFCYWKRKLGPP
jgi:hypothetical protein